MVTTGKGRLEGCFYMIIDLKEENRHMPFTEGQFEIISATAPLERRKSLNCVTITPNQRKPVGRTSP